jgi:hypothetical protein
MNHKQNIQIGAESKGLESLLVVAVVFDSKCVFIFQGNYRISKVNAVFSKI